MNQMMPEMCSACGQNTHDDKGRFDEPECDGCWEMKHEWERVEIESLSRADWRARQLKHILAKYVPEDELAGLIREVRGDIIESGEAWSKALERRTICPRCKSPITCRPCVAEVNDDSGQ